MRVIKESLVAVLKIDADICGRQYFDGVSSFQVPLANLGSRGLIWELPSRYDGVSEGVVEGFRSFMRERGDIRESTAKQSGRK